MPRIKCARAAQPETLSFLFLSVSLRFWKIICQKYLKFCMYKYLTFNIVNYNVYDNLHVTLSNGSRGQIVNRSTKLKICFDQKQYKKRDRIWLPMRQLLYTKVKMKWVLAVSMLWDAFTASVYIYRLYCTFNGIAPFILFKLSLT